MSNPFNYYNIKSYKVNFNGDSKCILMKFRIIKPYHTGYCSDCEWEGKIDEYEEFLPIPNYMININGDLNEEFKFITNGISEDNLPDWFGDWSYRLDDCDGNSGVCGYHGKEIVYIPLSFTYVSYYEDFNLKYNNIKL